MKYELTTAQLDKLLNLIGMVSLKTLKKVKLKIILKMMIGQVFS